MRIKYLCNFVRQENGRVVSVVFQRNNGLPRYAKQACKLLVRLLLPDALLPATTALGTLDASGRQQGVLSGCNVVMPNLSPMAVRQKYLLYDNKAGIGDDGESSLRKLRAQMQEIGYEVAVGRGDYTDGRTKQ